MTEAATTRKKLPLHWKMGIGFALGLVLGLIVHAAGPGVPGLTDFAKGVMAWVTTPLSGLFLNLIFMLIVPLIFSALIMGVSEMGDIRALGRIGWKTLAYTVLLSGIAVGIGLVLVNVLKPGAGVDPHVAAQMLSENAERSKEIVAGIHETPKGMDMLLSIVPSNVLQAASDNGAILSLMFFALMFGIGMVLSDEEKVAPLRRAVEGVFEVSMTLINLVIRLAPYAVACFMFNLAALFGFDLIIRLGAYVGVVVLALGLHMVVTYGTAVWLSGRSPLSFFRDTQEATVMAFSTASSNATLPTALFEGVTVIFLAQFFGVDLSIGQQIMVMAVCILGGIGTAGVPSGSLPVVAMICAMVGVNPLGIGLILGVNHFLDMCRTALNVTGDLALTTLVAKGETEDSPVPVQVQRD